MPSGALCEGLLLSSGPAMGNSLPASSRYPPAKGFHGMIRLHHMQSLVPVLAPASPACSSAARALTSSPPTCMLVSLQARRPPCPSPGAPTTTFTP